jgi:hypothetical protein
MRLLQAAGNGKSRLLTRGVVLVAKVLTLADRPERANAVGLTILGIHHHDSP